MANTKIQIDFLVRDEVSKALDKITKKLEGVDKQSKKNEKGFSQLGGVLQTAFGVSLSSVINNTVSALTNFFKEGIQGAIAFETQLQSLEIQVGNTADVFLTDLRDATKGLVSDLGLIQSANRAVALGLSRDNLPELFEVAAARAKIFGLSVEQATNDIVTGIGRASPLILDNLGIVINAEQTYADYAESIGKSATELTKAEKTLALQNSAIENGSGLVEAFNNRLETTSDKIQRLSSGFKNIKTDIGEALVDVVDFGVALADVDSNIDTFDNSVVGVNQSLTSIGDNVIKTRLQIDSLIDSIGSLSDDLDAIGAAETPIEAEIQEQVNREQLKQIQSQQKLNELEAQRTQAIRNNALEYSKLLDVGLGQEDALRQIAPTLAANIEIERQSIEDAKAALEELRLKNEEISLQKQIQVADTKEELGLKQDIEISDENIQKTLDNVTTALNNRITKNETEKTQLDDLNNSYNILLETQKEISAEKEKQLEYAREEAELRVSSLFASTGNVLGGIFAVSRSREVDDSLE